VVSAGLASPVYRGSSGPAGVGRLAGSYLESSARALPDFCGPANILRLAGFPRRPRWLIGRFPYHAAAGRVSSNVESTAITCRVLFFPIWLDALPGHRVAVEMALRKICVGFEMAIHRDTSLAFDSARRGISGARVLRSKRAESGICFEACDWIKSGWRALVARCCLDHRLWAKSRVLVMTQITIAARCLPTCYHGSSENLLDLPEETGFDFACQL